MNYELEELFPFALAASLKDTSWTERYSVVVQDASPKVQMVSPIRELPEGERE